MDRKELSCHLLALRNYDCLIINLPICCIISAIIYIIASTILIDIINYTDPFIIIVFFLILCLILYLIFIYYGKKLGLGTKFTYSPIRYHLG